jgi:hypothetical protein
MRSRSASASWDISIRYAIFRVHSGKDFFGWGGSAGRYVCAAPADGFVDVEFAGDGAFAKAFEGEGVERDAGGVFAGGAEVGGERVRDVDGHLHGVRVAFGRGVSGKI